VPPVSAGGSTSFASMFAALDALPPSLRRSIEGKTAKHDATYTSTGELRKGFKVESDVRLTPGAIHPIIRTHPESEQKALFLGRRTNGYINGLDVKDSDQLLDQLWAHATQPQFVYTHSWKVGDLLMWVSIYHSQWLSD
jgi:taurine dioxygenase